MVLYFESDEVTPPYHIYVGEDKVENEDLIKWGWPEDVWFHVDKLSSAHVYLRLHEGESIEDVPDMVIQDCAQLVKANSIQGNKMNNIEVVYTMWSNLKKTGDMAVGQVGFFKQKEVRNVKVEKRINTIVNRLNKTKQLVEKPDFKEMREERDRKLRNKEKVKVKEQQRVEKEAAEKKRKDAEERSYDRLFDPDKMKSNQDADNDSDDFM